MCATHVGVVQIPLSHLRCQLPFAGEQIKFWKSLRLIYKWLTKSSLSKSKANDSALPLLLSNSAVKIIGLDSLNSFTLSSPG